MFLFFILLFINLRIREIKCLHLLSLDLITDLTTERSDLKFFAVETNALVSFGKHDPP